MIFFVIGLAASIWCIFDIFKKEIPPKCKLGVSILVILTNWVGIVAYFFLVRDNLTKWCNKK